MPVFSGWITVDTALELLLRQQPVLWRGQRQQYQKDVIPTGFTTLNHALPGGGWHPGALTELLVKQYGIGEFSLLLPALKSLTAQQKWVALVNPPYIPYAPALENAGLHLDYLLIVDTDNDDEALWSIEQLLRTGTFSAVVGWIKQSKAEKQRRLQLAAETGQCWAVTYRPESEAESHSPAAFRLVLSVQQASLDIDICKSRGGKPRQVALDRSLFDQPQGVQWPCKKN